MPTVEHVAILSPGDMGAGIGSVLRKSGLDVLTCLDGRSNLTRLRALESEIREVGFYDDLVKEADLVLSVLPPGEAVPIAERVARALTRTGARLTYVDCNAVSPKTACRIDAIIREAGSAFVDAGIIGGPPSGPNSGTRFHCSAAGHKRLRSAAGSWPRCSCRRPSGWPGVRSQDGLCRFDQGHHRSVDGAPGGGQGAGPAGRALARARVQPHRRPGNPRHPLDAAAVPPLGRRDGGDCRNLRRRRPHASHLRRRGRHVPPDRRHPSRRSHLPRRRPESGRGPGRHPGGEIDRD